MFDQTKTEVKPELDHLSRPSQATEFLSKAAPVALGAAILGGIAAVGGRLDEFVNSAMHWAMS